MKYAIIENTHYQGSDPFKISIYGDRYILTVNGKPMETGASMEKLCRMAENPPAHWTWA